MSKFATILKVVGVMAVVVLVGIAVGWLGSRGGQEPNTKSPAATSRPSDLIPAAPPAPVATPPPAPAASLTNANPAPRALIATNLLTDWEDRVDQILTTDGPEADKAKQMMALFPRLPEDGQIEVAQHLSNLVEDKDYAPLGRFLTNSALPASVLDVLMTDVLNRPNSLKMPLLLEVARDPLNPKAAEAKELLEVLLEEDYGTDWTTWQAKVTQWLKDNPD